MDDYAGRVLADRYRLPLPPSDEYELTETRAFDTYSGQEVLVRQVPLPEVVEAEVLDAEGLPDGFTARDRGGRRPPSARTATRRPSDPAVRRAVEAAQAAARIPDHPRLDQVFDVFAEGGSLWIVSEFVAARPLAALLAEQPLTPYRAAEVASDVLMALRVLHAHGWVHRNITARTVLVCDDGRVMLTGLAVGAAEEALSGYDPVPLPEGEGGEGPGGPRGPGQAEGSGAPGTLGGSPVPVPPPVLPGSGGSGGSGAVAVGGTGSSGGAFGGTGGAQTAPGASEADPEAARRAAIQARAAGGLPGAGPDEGPGGTGTGAVERRALETGADIRAARAGAIAAYQAGARAAARVQEAQQSGRAALPGARPPTEGDTRPPAPHIPGQSGGATPPPYGQGHANGAAQPGYAPGQAGGVVPSPYGNGRAQVPGAGAEQPAAGGVPRGQIADPYGVRGAPAPWHGAAPRPQPGAAPAAPGRERSALPPAAPGAGGPRFELPGAQGGPPAVVPAQGTGSAPRWDEAGAALPGRRGPATALAAERARQVRMTVVGPVTERWAPEQAVPVHENWQLAAPIGPATDLWALGALLFRAVQGHAPYPEESTAELVQLVCSEPPAFAEECGSLRPVVESLLRQDPTERLDFEELRGWLRSLVRSAPEPDAGTHVVAAPPDPRRLPIVRRRGELVRRRRAGLPATHGRHKRAREEARSPRRLGRTLLLLVLLLLAAAVAYAMLFLPKKGATDDNGGDRTGSAGTVSTAPGSSASPTRSPTATPATQTQTTAGSTDGASVGDGFTLRNDPNGFRIAVAKGWSRTPKNSAGQVIYSQGRFELIVVAGRDGAATYGSDPMAYQRDKEPELQPYRDSSWATAGGLRTITVGQQVSAEGQFTWTDSGQGDLFVRNMVFLIGGRYHIVQVRGPESERDEVTKVYEQASSSYRYTG
ncbi:protein kinase [Streptomyces sp. NPDC006655]|uniref:protein kinase n=1 Tax=Streptomyces sp. NPDC006655 TaxID=3156898 RepID=UPI003451D96B